MKDTDLFIEPSEGTLTLNNPAKRNSFMDTPSKLVGTIILLILLVVVIVYFKSGRKESQVQSAPSSTMTQVPDEVTSGDIINPPTGKWVLVSEDKKPRRSTLISFSTDANIVKFSVRFNGSDSLTMPHYASCRPDEVSTANAEAMTRLGETEEAKINVLGRKVEIFIYPGQRYNSFIAHWERE